jgi:type II secretory pathway component GspD/PulD (secretin)
VRPGGAKPPISVLTLKHAKAAEILKVLGGLFPTVEMIDDPRTNSLVVRADEKTLAELKELLSKLDVEVGRPK